MTRDRIYSASELGRIPVGFRVLEVRTPAGNFYCLSNRVNREIQERHRRSTTVIWREGAIFSGCGLTV